MQYAKIASDIRVIKSVKPLVPYETQQNLNIYSDCYVVKNSKSCIKLVNLYCRNCEKFW